MGVDSFFAFAKFESNILTMTRILLLSIFCLSIFSCKPNAEKETLNEETDSSEMEQTADRSTDTEDEEMREGKAPDITPISHATMVMEWGDNVIYVDPVGGMEAFQDQPKPDLILVTDIHGDHMNKETIQAVRGNATLIAPQAVADALGKDMQVQVMSNGSTQDLMGISIKAVPMYNTTEERKNFHVKGRGNGYLLNKDDYKVYISGDTEDIPEMRNLENVDMAFICMNLPYTMTVDQAISAAKAFQPAVAIPYHYRGKNGLSDVEKFKQEVGKLDGVEVRLLEWYPERE